MSATATLGFSFCRVESEIEVKNRGEKKGKAQGVKVKELKRENNGGDENKKQNRENRKGEEKIEKKKRWGRTVVARVVKGGKEQTAGRMLIVQEGRSRIKENQGFKGLILGTLEKKS